MIFLSGCAVKSFVAESTSFSDEGSLEKIVSSVRRNNISEESFVIEKANCSMTRNNERTRFIFNVKFNKPDTYLLSIRNSAGIEGARIYISKDTLLINDRMGKKVLHGSPQDLEKISGFPLFVLKMVFGDFVPAGGNKILKSEKSSNKVFVLQEYQGNIFQYILDIKAEKVLSIVVKNSVSKEELTINYAKFSNSAKHIPGIIEVNDLYRNLHAKIRLDRVIVPWEGEIEFIPGKGYTNEKIK